MGYETRFKLTYDAKGKYLPQCKHEISAKSKYCPECGLEIRQVPLEKLVEDAIQKNDNLAYSINQQSKWYNWEKHMREFSKKFPTICFKLHGEGEESGDIWDAYFLNGKCQVKKAKIIIDECDPTAWK